MKAGNKQILKDKFKLGHLSELELDYLISEVNRLSNTKRKSPPVTDELRQRVIKMARDGMPRKEIAKAIDYSISTIDNILKKHNK